MPPTDLPFDPTDPASYRVWYSDSIRFADLDPLGHVNNNAIGVYFEDARLHLFTEARLYRDGHAKGGQASVVVRLAIDFLKEIDWPNDIRVGSRVTKVGTSSFGYVQGLFVGDTCHATAETVQVLFDPAARTKVALDAGQKERLAALMT